MSVVHEFLDPLKIADELAEQSDTLLPETLVGDKGLTMNICLSFCFTLIIFTIHFNRCDRTAQNPLIKGIVYFTTTRAVIT